MARKNNNAGQPNRSAQTVRRAERRYRNEKHRPVMGPLSENLISEQPRKEDLKTQVTPVVRELVNV